MLDITEVKLEESIQLNVDGRIDTATVAVLQNAILTSFQKTKNLVINLEKVAYVSSAGLRAFLLGQKTAASKGGRLTLIHVGETVMEVLQMTGFDRMLNIEQ